MTASACSTCHREHPIMLTVVDVVFGKEHDRRVCSPCFRQEMKERRE